MSLPTPLSAKFEGSFAYSTVKDRLPDILTKALDTFHREWKTWKSDESNEETRAAEAKAVIGQLSKLHYLMMTDKELEDLEYEERPDFFTWKAAFEKERENQGSPLTWFSSRWLFVECYLYRRIADLFLYHSRHFHSYDPFESQKQASLKDNIESVRTIGRYVTNEASTVRDWLELSLWGNRCDLSLSSTTPSFDNIVERLKQLKAMILVNDIKVVLDRIDQLKNQVDVNQIVDIVLDNAGFEFFTDLCLMHCLTTNLPSLQKLRIHVKSYPWFVSDVMSKDVPWTLEILKSDSELSSLAMNWSSWISSGKWEVIDSNFWTLPYDYNQMPEIDPQLYSSFQKSSLTILKGDLNYRKLLGDLDWPHETPFETTLRNFKPGFLVALRTNKADLICGLENESSLTLPGNYLVSGQYAVIQAFKGQ